jgi:hypothetical protein
MAVKILHGQNSSSSCKCARQQDMVLRGREVVGLELSGCCVVSICCSNAGENVVSGSRCVIIRL